MSSQIAQKHMGSMESQGWRAAPAAAPLTSASGAPVAVRDTRAR